MNETEVANLVGDALRVTSAALRPWIEGQIGEWPQDYKGRVEPRDPSYLIWIALNYKPVRLAKVLAPDGRLLLEDLRHTRNRWAHHVPFDELDGFRGIDTCRRILLAVGADGAAGTLESQMRRLLAAATVPAETKPSARLPGPTARSEVPTGHRRMRSAEFRDFQWAHRFDPHVEPINRLVDDLIEERDGSWMPYIPPYHGGIESKILLLYQDPGKMTSTEHGGSGFLGCENDDPSAQVAAECLDAAGIAQREITSWNAYPWFLPDQGGLTSRMIDEGLDPLRRVVELMPEVHTVVTGGKKAHESWRRFADRYPTAAGALRHLETFHTSGQGIVNGGQQTKAEGVAHVVATFRAAAVPPPAGGR